MNDTITESQEWIDNLVSKYAPKSEDVDVALQNMGLTIKKLDDELSAFKNPKNWTRSYDYQGNLIDKPALYRPKLAI